MKEENTDRRKESIKKKTFDLQKRFIEYAAGIIKLAENIPETKAGKHICSQILRSGTSPAPNYGEAQSAESTSDFIHKLKIALKELRETEVWLKIILQVEMIQPSKLFPILTETDELIAIPVKSIQTSKKNKER
jgi:four helix bundle protein